MSELDLVILRNGEPMKMSLSRRTFLQGSALTLAGAGSAMLVGCDSTSTEASGNAVNGHSSTQNRDSQQNSPSVYLTRDISAPSLVKAYQALAFSPQGKVAVKLSTGETGSNYLRPELIADLVHALDATIVECNTAYGGERSTTESHRQLIADHGFTSIADVDIMDAEEETSLPVSGGSHLTEDIVGMNLLDYGSMVVLSHFKGHAMGGFGGALKNISIGVAAREGKFLIHSAGASSTSWVTAAQDDFLESMAEAASAVAAHFGSSICYVNVMNNLSVDCDCDTHPASPEMADIGILASLDPVALDQACVDLVYAASDGAALVERIESRNGIHTLEWAERVGVGSRSYELVEV